MYKIEDNVEMPELKRTRKRKFRFNEMDVGQSMLMADKNLDQARHIASRANRENRGSMLFRARQDDEGCVRIWRVE